MKISALRLYNVKQFAERGIAIESIGDGVNVLCAANEAGKSTSFEALHALFFQPHTGTPKDVQRLRPYSGGSPYIEADITTEDGAFRLAKQYYSGRLARVSDLATGRLLAQADEAENLISDLVTGGSTGPAGLLWVRQGITGLEKRSQRDEDNEKQIRAGLLESVQGEVEAITGGRRMADIMAICSEELSSLVTGGGRVKTGGHYAQAIVKRDQLAEEERRLGEQVHLFRDALARKATATKRLEELNDPEEREHRKTAVERAQTTLDKAKRETETFQAAVAAHALAAEYVNTAKEQLETYSDAEATALELEASLTSAEHTRQQARNRKAEILQAIEAAEVERDAAEAAEQEALERLGRAEAAARALADATQIEALEHRLHEAEEVRRKLEEGEAKLTLLDVPASAVEELQALDVDIAKLRATATAMRPTVQAIYEAGAHSALLLDDEPLEGEEERSYEGRAKLSVPGIGVVTLRSGHADSDDGKLAQAEHARGTILASIGVPDLAAAMKRQADAQSTRIEVEGLQQQLNISTPNGITELRGEIARRRETLEGITATDDDPAIVREALVVVRERRAVARQSLQEVQSRRSAAEDDYVAAEANIAGLQAELKQIDNRLGAKETRSAQKAALMDNLRLRSVDLEEKQSHVEALRSNSIDLASAEAAFDRVKSVEVAADKEAGKLREEIAGLNGQIRTEADDAIEEEWREAQEALTTASARVSAFEKEVQVLQRLQTALMDARSAARDIYLKPVMEELTPLLKLLFEDVTISFDEQTLLPQTIQRNGLAEDVERLSGGMREQLSILTRLAFARLLARDDRRAPVILDDALVYSDDDRIERMFDALHRQSRDLQIIVFSCRQRAFAKLGGNILQMADWRPSG